MDDQVPSEAAVLEYLDTLSNWGRWGAADELGTLNLITPATRLRALDTVAAGISVGCARPIVVEPPVLDVLSPPSHYMIGSGEGRTEPDSRASTASDYIGVASHGVTITHVDTLSHFFWDDQMYNGRPSNLVTTRQGATVGSVEPMRDGIVTRGILFDIAGMLDVPFMDAGDAIHPRHLEAFEEMHGVRLEEGDALLVRTGWPIRRETLGPYPIRRHRPGLHASTLPWLHERGVAIIAADAPHDVQPSRYEQIPMPIHTVGLVAMGLCLVDNCQFEDLIAACREHDRWEFLFILAPLRFPGATASPLTPLAVF